MMNLEEFIKFKTHPELQNLDENILLFLSNNFDNLDKNKNKKQKKNLNILKTQKVQNKKDNITNKINLILNKLSETNQDNLIIEFLDCINQVEEEEYKVIQKTFYLKMISEINFSKLYLSFLKQLNYIYNKVQNYNLEYLISIVEDKFNFDYNMDEYKLNYEFLNSLEGEEKRTNNLIIIKNMVDLEILKQDIYNELQTRLLNQTRHFADIYNWFVSIELKKEEKKKISNILKSNDINNRDRILLENLLNNKNSKEVIEQKIINININTLKLEIDNIIEEYLFLENIEDIKYFITNKCKDSINKNIFCETLIDKYFQTNKLILIDLLEILVKEHILYKSNISRGILMIYNVWNNVSIDYLDSKNKMIILLDKMKTMGITKGLDNINIM